MKILSMGIPNPTVHFECCACGTLFEGNLNELKRTRSGTWWFHCPACGMNGNAFITYSENEEFFHD